MGLLHDDLDHLKQGDLRGLAASVMASERSRVGWDGGEQKKLRLDQKRKNKRSRGHKKGKGRRFDWEKLDGVGLNQTIKVEIELPGYFVAAMNQTGFSYREAVQEYLVKRGQTWWQPRFLVALKAKQIEMARARFTRQQG